MIMKSATTTPIVWKSLKQAMLGLGLISACGLSYADVAPLTVSGNKVLVGGLERPIAGNSLFYSNVEEGAKFYNEGAIAFLKEDMDSSLVRAFIVANSDFSPSTNFINDPQRNLELARAAADAAIANDMYVIFTWFSEDAAGTEQDAILFFSTLASEYGHLNNVIYEIYSSPGVGIDWSTQIKPYEETVLSALREIDPDNLVIVGTPNFSTNPDIAAQDPITDVNLSYGFSILINDTDTIAAQTSNVVQAMDDGAAVFASDWFFFDNSPGIPSHFDDLMDFFAEQKISHANFAVSDQAGNPSAMLEPGAMVTGGWSSYTENGLALKSTLLSWNERFENIGDCSILELPQNLQAEHFCSAEGISDAIIDQAPSDRPDTIIMADNDTLTFEVTNPKTVLYDIFYRVGALSWGKTLQLENVNTGEIYQTINVPNSGNLFAFNKVGSSVEIPQGRHTLRLRAINSSLSIDSFSISIPHCSERACPELTLIEAEDFVQMQGVQTETTDDVLGGDNVGWLDSGDWMIWNLDLPQSSTGNYAVNYRIAAEGHAGRLKLEQAGGGFTYGEIAIAHTGGWQNWATVTHMVEIPAGEDSIAIAVMEGGWNLNWFQVEAIDIPSPSPSPTPSQSPTPTPTPTPSICDGVTVYPNWLHKDWSGGENTHVNTGEQMVHMDKLYVANWYANTVPGSDASWSFVDDCNAE
ncbi:MAG: endoglucanase [Flavobacteriales bacterium]|jgi:endoglucanase